MPQGVFLNYCPTSARVADSPPRCRELSGLFQRRLRGASSAAGRVAGVGSSRARKTVAPREPVCDRCRVPQPILRTARLLLVPLAGRHLGLEARLDSDPEVLRYLDRRARSRDEVGEQYAYLQVADDLERRISEGEIEVKLPSERDLAEDYGVA
jgi:hypothetical protein